MSIQRYGAHVSTDGRLLIELSKEVNGHLVKYEDHEAIVARVVSHFAPSPIITLADAKQSIIATAGDVGDNASSLDAAADALLLRVSAFFGECVGGSSFCGLAIDETRDANGLIQSLRLVACDIDKQGEAVRRVGK